MIRIITSLVVVLTMGTVKAQTASGSVPKLVVGITIDQLRGDYLEQFKHSFGEKGFKRLLAGGLVYQNMSFDFSNLNRASTQATIYTGANPIVHGITGDEVYLPLQDVTKNIFVDDDVLGNYTQDKFSPRALRVSTITDELNLASNGQSDIFSFAPNASQALISGGHGANSVYWIDDYSGKWASSTYFKDFYWTVDQDNRKADNYSSQVWGAYWEPKLSKSDLTAFPYTKTESSFQHSLGDDKGTYVLSKTTPFANANIAETAVRMMAKADLGKRDVPDFLALTFYAGNYQNATDNYGLELKDLYVQLDKDIEIILDEIDKTVGLQNTLIFLTSTGYYDSLLSGEPLDARGDVFYIDRCKALLNMYLMALYGQDEKWVIGYHDEHIYLNRELIKAKGLDLAEIQRVAAEFTLDFSGIQAVYTQKQLLLDNVSNDLTQLRNSISKENAGDLIIEIQPGFRIASEKTLAQKEKIKRCDMISCPVIFYGHNIKPELVKRAVNATEIAPSIAYIMRIRAPSAARNLPLIEIL